MKILPKHVRAWKEENYPISADRAVAREYGMSNSNFSLMTRKKVFQDSSHPGVIALLHDVGLWLQMGTDHKTNAVNELGEYLNNQAEQTKGKNRLSGVVVRQHPTKESLDNEFKDMIGEDSYTLEDVERARAEGFAQGEDSGYVRGMMQAMEIYKEKRTLRS